MTDRVRTLEVLLEEDLREDDAAELRRLIERVRGVAQVTQGPAVTASDRMASDRMASDRMARAIAKAEPRQEIWGLLIPEGL